MRSAAGPEPVVDRPVIGDRPVMTVSVDAGPIEIAWRKNQAFIDAARHRYVLVHAAVASRNGATVIFPGAPESGKSTLVAGLVRRGWDYLSDELALVDPGTGFVTPYARKINIDPPAYWLFPELTATGYDPAAEQWHVDPLHLRERSVGSAERRITHVVFNRFEPSAPTRIEPAGKASTLVDLIANAMRFESAGSAGFDVLADLAQNVRSHRLVSGDLDEQIAVLEELAST